MKNEDISRFKVLGVVANYTLHWHGDYYQAGDVTLGKRNKNKMRAQPLINDGATVTFSSDVFTPDEIHRANPFLGIQIGHNRQDLDGGENAPIMLPISERLSLKDIIKGYTINASYQLRMNEVRGSIERGKFADFVVLKESLFKLNRYDIHKTEPEMTFVDGKMVFKNT